METAAHEYYRALDSHSYDDLADLLAPEFTHYRPDRTIEGRESFVTFMCEKRPMKETAHEVRAIYTAAEGVAVRGRLLGNDGEELFGFVDCFEFAEENSEIVSIETYSQ